MRDAGHLAQRPLKSVAKRLQSVRHPSNIINTMKLIVISISRNWLAGGRQIAATPREVGDASYYSPAVA